MRRRLEAMLGGPAAPLGVLVAVVVLEDIGNGALGVLGPEVTKTLRISVTSFGLVFLFSVLVLMASPLAFGYLADRFPRPIIALAGVGAWVIGTFGTWLAIALWLLIVARVVSSLGYAVSGPVHDSLLSDYYPLEGRGTAFAVHRASRQIGATCGALAAGAIGEWVGWQWLFSGLFVAGLTTIPWVLRLPEPVRGQHDLVKRGGSSAASRLKPLGMWRSFKLLFQIISWKRYAYTFVFVGMAFFAIIPLSGFFYEAVFGIGAFGRGVILAGFSAATVVGVFLGARLGESLIKKNARLMGNLVAACVFAGAVGFTLQGLAATIWGAIMLLVLTGVAIAAATVPFAMIVSATAPAHVRGQAFGAITVFAAVGALFIPIGLAIGDWLGFRATYILFSQGFAIAGLLALSASKFIQGDIDRAETIGLAEAEIAERRARGEKIDLVRAIDLDVAYGNVQVLFGVDFSVEQGEIVGLLGTNGAGKSTLLKAISGLVKPSGGIVLYDGQDITGMDAEAASVRGIIQVPGGKGVFPTLTVEKNLLLGGFQLRKDQDQLNEAMAKVLKIFPKLAERRDQLGGTMSGGEQQMLTLAQAFMQNPRLLMIDELSLGLAPVVVRELLDTVRGIHESGVTVILVEQSVNVALTLAKRAVFMEKGEIQFSGLTEELLDRGDLLRSVFLSRAEFSAGARR